ncbi:MAG: DUF927 domain-containing protein [Clostridia bacterium]|nr:DUF927 domain-containing protein [Clostridia bacterium]MBQ8689572.1 DUF927 domain-containing protein [Clostridia bacterium]
METNNEQFTCISENYRYSKDGTLYYVEGKQGKNGVVYEECSTIANHTPLLKEYRTIDNGIETVEELVFNALRNYSRGADTILSLKNDVYSQTPNLKFGAACRITLGRGAKSRYSEAMQIQCENAPHAVIYQHTGYAYIDGERVFLNGDFSIGKDGTTNKCNVSLPEQMKNYRFVESRDAERFDTLLKMFPSVASNELVYSGLGLAFLTPLNSLLRDIGIEPCFILYFTGKTGTRKTTMAKLILNFFGTYDNGTAPPASFRDTTNAVELKFALADSTLMLLDDRIPSTTPKIKAQMEAMEQAVARQIGDRSGRARMNADGTLRATYRPNCNLIITAEESFSNVGESAIARSISVELKPGDVDLSKLTEVQQRATHLNQCMGDYIQWVISNWESISERAKPMFLEFRNKAQSGGHGRLAECVAHLQIGIVSMCEWLRHEKIITDIEANAIQRKSWDIFVALAEAQNRRIAEEKPVKLFLDAIKEMRDRKTINIFDLDNPSQNSNINVIGYRDKDFYYFYPDSIYSEVKKFYIAQDKNYPLGKTALFQQLADDGLIEKDKEQNTKTKRVQGKRPRLLWLRADVLNDNESEEVTYNGE